MHKLLVINTGGTIGMKMSTSGLIPATDFLESYCRTQIINKFNDLEVLWIELDPLIDSSHINPENWNLIAGIIANHYTSCDSVLIIHGTDTLAYTSSVLGFMLRNLDKPVVITGSMLAIQENHSDGPNNLEHAITTCLSAQYKGVLVCFNGKIMPGEHVTKVNSSEKDAFTSPFYDQIQEIESVDGRKDFFQIEVHSQSIDVFTFYPGCSYDALESMVNNTSKAIILRTFGSGNSPESDRLNQLIQQAIVKDKIVINISQCVTSYVDMTRYSAGSALLASGVISPFNMTFEAVTGKLLVLFSQFDEISIIKQQFLTKWAREFPES